MLHLDNLKIYNPAALAKGAEYSGNVLVAPGATVGKGCLIGPDVSIGDGCVIGDGVRLSNCVVMRGVRIKDHSKVRTCADFPWAGGALCVDVVIGAARFTSTSEVVCVKSDVAVAKHSVFSTGSRPVPSGQALPDPLPRHGVALHHICSN
jgi:NDP-sugar pyrophosphorylase family protein